MSEQLAKELGMVGPVARGSNVPYDVRSVAPYLLYKEIGFKPVVEKDGDCWARSVVRVRELYQSIDIIRLCLPLLDGAPAEDFRKAREAAGRRELRPGRSAQGRAVLLRQRQKV